MAYSRIWDDTIPTGAEAANTIGQIFRNLKSDLDERLVDIFGMASMATDPLRPYVIKFSTVPTTNDFLPGAASGIRFRDIANANTNLSIADNGNVSIRGGLTLGSLTAPLNITGNGSIITLTNNIPANNFQGLTLTGTTTGAAYLNIANTGNSTLFGVESSTGGVLYVGTTAYSTVYGTASARSLHLVTSNAVRLTIDSTGAVSTTGTLTVLGTQLIVGGGVNPYLNLSDGSGSSYIQVVGGAINLSSRTGSHTVSGDLSITGGLNAGITTLSNAIRLPGNGAPCVLARNAANTLYLDLLLMDATDNARIPRALTVTGGLTISGGGLAVTSGIVANTGNISASAGSFVAANGQGLVLTRNTGAATVTFAKYDTGTDDLSTVMGGTIWRIRDTGAGVIMSLTNAGNLTLSGAVNNGSSSASIASGVATTIATIPNPTATSVYIVTAYLNSAVGGNVGVATLVVTYSGASGIFIATPASLNIITGLSVTTGGAIQVTQSSGAAQTVFVTWTKLG